MTQLTGSRLDPVSKTIQKIVIILHGYGASGDDLLSLAVEWQQQMPNTLFLLPNAPTYMAISGGYQWFNLPDLSYPTLIREIDPAIPALHKYIDYVLGQYHVSEQDVALVGFSQGGMMALGAALIRTRPMAAVVSYSGAFVLPETYTIDTAVPVLLIHGDQDQVVPVMYQTMSQKALLTRGVFAETYICKNIGHGINQEGIARGQNFLWQNLNAPRDQHNSNTQGEN